jgi:ent-kaurene oxidase
MTQGTVQALIDLCAYPQCISDLRQEARHYLGAHDEPWQLSQINELVLLDSFLKESQRHNPPNYLSFNRIATRSFTLSAGTHIPKGQSISMPAGPMAMDADFYPEPERFDMHRFVAAAQSGGDGDGERREREFAATERGNVHWGSGRFTCPGR